MARDDNDRVFVRSTIELTHNLGLGVVAEGVEDERTYNDLLRFGCDVAQGHLIGRAVPPDEIERAVWAQPERTIGYSAPLGPRAT